MSPFLRSVALAAAAATVALPAHAEPAPEPAPAAAAPRPKSVAVMDTLAKNAPESLAAFVSSTLAEYATNALSLEVVAKKDLADRVSLEQQKMLLGCDSEACAPVTNIGEALAVERLVTSSLSGIGDKFALSVVALDVRSTRVLGRLSRVVPNEAELGETARDLLHFVLTGENRESKGSVRLLVTQAGAKITIDGAEAGSSPLQVPPRLLAGRHRILVEKEGFIPFEGAVEVKVGQEEVVEVRLLPKSEVKLAGAGFLPWAGATGGVAVAAGVVSALAYMHAFSLCQQFQLDLDAPTPRCYQPGSAVKPVSLADKVNPDGSVAEMGLVSARRDVEFYGNTVHFYSAWGAGVLGGVSVALFSAYFLSGLGAGGDAPPGPVTVEPTPDGFAVRF